MATDRRGNEIAVQLPHNGSLDDLGQERQVGDRSKVGSVRKIEARLLQARRDDGVLLALGVSLE